MSKAKKYSVFISHSSYDKLFAELVGARLHKNDLNAWIDSKKILVGDNILEGIGRALTTMDLLLFIVSHASLSSSWVKKELEYANAREVKQKEILILPFIIDDTPMDKLPWYISARNAHRVTPDRASRRVRPL
jgi:hypothetical protein